MIEKSYEDIKTSERNLNNSQKKEIFWYRVCPTRILILTL